MNILKLKCLSVFLVLFILTIPVHSKIPVVLDTDIGTDIDDTWALAYILNCPELDVKMVVTATADPVYRAKIAAKFLDIAGRSDVDVGIGVRGAPSVEFQKPWVEDYDLEDYSGVIHEDGVAAFIDLVHSSPETITCIAVGALPNLQEALRRDPSIAGKVRFIGMHGSIDIGYGGSPEPSAEANVVSNVPAFKATLAADWKEFLITPLDTCGLVVLGGENYQRIKNSDSPMLKALMENYYIWKDLVTWTTVDYIETRSSTLFDTVAVYMAYESTLLEYETVKISTTDEGYTIRDPNGKPVEAAMRWTDLNAFYDHMTERLLKTPGKK